MATLLKDDSLTPVIWALSPVIVLGTVTEVPTGMLQRDFAFRALAFRSVAAVVVSSAVAVVMALNGFGAWSLVAQTLTFYFLRAVAVWVMAGWFRRSWSTGECFVSLASSAESSWDSPP